jgi:PleD family two-component response regulator
MKVLIIERSRLQQTVLSRIFTGEGIIASLASTYAEAMDKLQQEQLFQQAMKDTLTGLHNRHAFKFLLTQTEQYRRYRYHSTDW